MRRPNMKFETKIKKYGIDENEVKNIIENCFCGEVNGAYLLDLSKMRKWEIMETIGNYLDTDKLDFNVTFKTFLKTYEIEPDEVKDLFIEGFNEQAGDIAYTLESHGSIILVLTDDERHNNSFVQYAPSQTGAYETGKRFVAYYNHGDTYILDTTVQADLTMHDACNLINYTLNENRFEIKTLSIGTVLLKDNNVRRLLNVYETADFLNTLKVEEDY